MKYFTILLFALLAIESNAQHKTILVFDLENGSLPVKNALPSTMI